MTRTIQIFSNTNMYIMLTYMHLYMFNAARRPRQQAIFVQFLFTTSSCKFNWQLFCSVYICVQISSKFAFQSVSPRDFHSHLNNWMRTCSVYFLDTFMNTRSLLCLAWFICNCLRIVCNYIHKYAYLYQHLAIKSSISLQ